MPRSCLDLFTHVEGKPYGFEFKRTDVPKLTPSMRIALDDLNLRRLFVIFPGHQTFSLPERVTALGLGVLNKRLKALLR